MALLAGTTEAADAAEVFAAAEVVEVGVEVSCDVPTGNVTGNMLELE